METISVAIQKGGTGKTTTVHALGYGLINKGKKILFVDLDPQCNLSFTVGVDLINENITLYDVFTKKQNTEAALHHIQVGMDILTGGLQLSAADMTFTDMNRAYLLKESISDMAQNYDYVLIDCPPSLNVLTMNALAASDKIIVPLAADIYSLQGIAQFNGFIENVRKYCNNPGLKVDGLLITKYTERNIISRTLQDAINQAAQELNTKVYETRIRSTVTVSESQLSRTDLYSYNSNATATQDYNDFTEEFLKGDHK